MGMTYTLYRATQAEIDHLIEEPAAVANFLDPDDGSAPRVRTVRPTGLLGLALRLFPITITEVVSDPREDVAPRVIDPDRRRAISCAAAKTWTMKGRRAH